MKRYIIAVLTAVIFTTVYASSPEPVIRDDNKTQFSDVRKLRGIFSLRETVWDFNGQPILVIVRDPDSYTHSNFVSKCLRVNKLRLQSKVNQRLNAGESGRLTIVHTENEMLELVAADINAIGYSSNSVFMLTEKGLRRLRGC